MAHPAARERGVDVVRVLPRVEALGDGGGPYDLPGQPQQRPTHPAGDSRHAGERAATGPAGQPQQDRLRLVLAGVAEQDGGCAEAVRGLVEGGMPGSAGGVLGSPPGTDPDRGHLDGVQPERPQLRRDGQRSVGRAGLETVVDGDGRHTPRGVLTLVDSRSREGQRVGAAAARDEHEIARLDVGQRLADGPSDVGHRRGRSAHASGCTRATQRAGSPISAGVGRFAGSSHTRLKPVMPDGVDDAADEHRTIAVLAELGVHAEELAKRGVRGRRVLATVCLINQF